MQMSNFYGRTPLLVTVSLVLCVFLGTSACKSDRKTGPAVSPNAGAVSTTTAPVQEPPSPPGDQAVEKASLAVLDFTVHTSNRPDFHQQYNTNYLTDKLVTALAETRKFRIVERERVDSMLKEFKLSEQGFTDKKHAVDAGEMVGADFLVMGSLSNIGVSSQVEEIPYTKERVTTLRGSLDCDLRIVNSRTGEIAAAWRTKVDKRKSSASGVGYESIYNEMNHELAQQIAVKIIAAVYPIKVASVGPGGTLFLNRGEGGGLKVGDQLEIFEVGQAILDPDTHEVIGTQDRNLGTAKVTEVQQRLTVARVVNSLQPVQPGAILRPFAAGAGREGGSSSGSADRPKLNW